MSKSIKCDTFQINATQSNSRLIQLNIRLKFDSWFKRPILHGPNRIQIMLNNLRLLEWEFKTRGKRSAILLGKKMRRLNQISRTYSFEWTEISAWFGACKMRRLNRALDLIRSNFASLVYGNCRDTPCCKCFIHVKRKFWKKIRYFPSGNFRRLYSTNCQVIAYWRLKTNKQKNQS